MKKWLYLLPIFALIQDAPGQVPAQRLQNVGDRLAGLLEKGMDFWATYGPDAVNGGFYGTLNSAGQPIGPTNKSIVLETRHLWTLSYYYARRDSSATIKALADNVYGFITQNMINAGNGEVYNMVTAAGAPADASHPLYMDGFAIYGLSRYALSFSKPEASALAMEIFRAMEKYHDPVHGGYDESPQPGLLQYRSSGGSKCTNTHLHLMEAFTTLYEATRDAAVKARVLELSDIMVRKIRQPAGYNNLEFTADWTPVAPATVSYGHDLEAAWLLLETAQVLGIPDDTGMVACAKQIGMLSSEQGWHAAGGYYNSGALGRPASSTSKVWWVQAEAMEGNWRLYQLTGDTVYFNRLEGTLKWIEDHHVAPAGEWYQTVSASGNVTGSTNMSDQWKSSYHSMRALINTGDWIRQSLAPVGVRAGAQAGRPGPAYRVEVLDARTHTFRNPCSRGPCMVTITGADGRISRAFPTVVGRNISWTPETPGIYFIGIRPSEP